MCVFCEIAMGQTAADIVFEDESTVAFLDMRPVFLGHTLLIPRAHYETLPDLPDDLLPSLFSNAKMLAAAVPSALGAEGTFMAINNKISQSVPHLHVHVVPRRPKDGLRGFFWPRQSYASDEQRGEIADAIRAAVAELR
ncbi:MAG: HIT family protein [Actinobacteria bacterium]|nr:HIT family protein [Actinomycetota bacterium]